MGSGLPYLLFMLQVFVPTKATAKSSQIRAGSVVIGAPKGAGSLLVSVTGKLDKKSLRAVREAAEIHSRATARKVVRSDDFVAVADLDRDGEMFFVSDESRQVFRAWAKTTSKKKKGQAR